MAPEHSFNVEGCRVEMLGDGCDFLGLHKQEHGLGIDEPANEPWARDAINLRALPGNPSCAPIRITFWDRRGSPDCRSSAKW